MSDHRCLNCGNQNAGHYCSECGQQFRDNGDRSLRQLGIELVSSFTFADSRFFRSLGTLVARPGRMTVEILDGKRKRYMTPLSLFLFINLVFFLFNPVSDYSLSLYEQTELQPYHQAAAEMVEKRLLDSGRTFEEYSIEYDRTSNNVSKALIILNVPAIALFVWLVSIRRRPFYFDSLVFSFHFFSILMLSVTLGYILFSIIIPMTGIAMAEGIFLLVFGLLLPFSYAIKSFIKFLRTGFLRALLSSIVVYIGVLTVQFVYRGIIFIVTFYAT